MRNFLTYLARSHNCLVPSIRSAGVGSKGARFEFDHGYVEETLLGLNPVREDQAMLQVARRLVGTFASTHSREHVEEKVTTVRHHFDGRPVRDFVPILVERMVRQELRTP